MEVRRAFSRYVELSQRLTSAMRKDSSRLVGRPWAAATFPEWTPATELLKYLRNRDQHGEQVFVTVHDRHYYKVPDDVEISGIPAREFIVDSHWQMTDQMLDRPPSGLEVSLTDPSETRGPGEVLHPVRTESRYVLYPRNSEDELKVTAAGVSDIHAFAADTFAILGRYYDFFREQLGI